MEYKRNVFSTNIIRSNYKPKNNLYELLNIVPVQPLPAKTNEKTLNDHCVFVPKNDRFYIPKKKSSLRVQTVRDIRNNFEKYVYSYLPTELEKQKNLLLRKIRYGFSKDKKTKELAFSMLKSDTPVSKSAWQMLMNINPEEKKFSFQYIHWKGKCIQVNGSKGGHHKFIWNCDAENFKQAQKKCASRSTILKKKRQLLHNSLNVKFKPGPLSKKKYLDDSYQKYQFGEIEVVDLPMTCLEVQTSYGKPLAPVIETFINKSFTQIDGLITPNWAKFAVSVLGKNEKGIVSQETSEDSCVSFDLNYKCFQNKILMRHDSDILNDRLYEETTKTNTPQEDSIIISEIRSVMDNVLNTVEISLKQDEMYTGEDEPRETITYNNLNTITNSNNKTKRNGELHRLDVTVITISKTTGPDKTVMCQKNYCTLGCICDSLKCSYNLKTHCGLIECMFKCKCDFSKYKYMNSFDNDECSDIIPGLINLDKTLGQTLAKEEHKFHQTVIVTDDRSILLKSNKRIWKASKKYAEFYSNMQLKTERISTEMLSIDCIKLDCENIEPWCMVHNLYKCFCKGRYEVSEWKEETKSNENDISKSFTMDTDPPNIDKNSINEIANVERTSEVPTTRLRRIRQNSHSEKYTKKYHLSKESYVSSDISTICARVQPYEGRKYNDKYYNITNKKIFAMEKNDKTLHKKMLTLCSEHQRNDDDLDKDLQVLNVAKNMPSSLNDVLVDKGENTKVHNEKELAKRLPAKTKLVSWLGESYKEYKKLVDRGLLKSVLGPPKLGKPCLYSWEFILSRYRERKNYFLVSKQSPYRLFVAVDISNKFYDNCTNISDIALTDIDKYPITVKNLLTNAKDLKENFCILYGLAHCWEIVGSVTKVIEIREDNTLQQVNTQELLQEENNTDSLIPPQEVLQKKNETDNLTDSQETLSEMNTSNDEYNLKDLPIIIDNSTNVLKQGSCTNVPEPNVELSETPVSKWFVMKVENDFSEIQFTKKGFFVKYESVVKAINVAKLSGKTVRLSSHKYPNDLNDPQFGIYAIPSNSDCCVFIGPYEKNECLGIEAIKKVQSMEKVIPEFRTRGLWITTNKADNIKVIDNPLQFISPTRLNNDIMVTLDSDSTVKYNEIPNELACNAQTNIPRIRKTKQTTVKQVKPIKIRKTNGFYHLTSNGRLTPIQSPEKELNKTSLLTNVFTDKHNFKSSLKSFSPPTQGLVSQRSKVDKPIAEIAPNIKLDVNRPIERNRRSKRGMFVLNPEEINKRSFEKNILYEHPQTNQQHTVPLDIKEVNMPLDVEKFLATSLICTAPSEEVFVISDDENEISPNHCILRESYKNVWIVCKSIENIGWIPGKKNIENCISFEFPGFEYTKFYPECEALEKISQILARKVYVPKHIKLKFQVLESEDEIKSLKKLDETCLLPQYILTKKGFRHKFDVMTSLESLNEMEPSEITEDVESLNEDSFKQKTKIMKELEEASRTLEDESIFLWDKAISRKDEILESFAETSEELRNELTEQLSCIVDNTEK